MTDLISRSAVLNSIEDWMDDDTGDEFDRGYDFAMRRAMRIIRNAHAVDAVPVVRCKDCKHRCTYKCPMYHTETCIDDLDGFDDYNVDRTDNDGFCHLGARMDGDADG